MTSYENVCSSLLKALDESDNAVDKFVLRLKTDLSDLGLSLIHI